MKDLKRSQSKNEKINSEDLTIKYPSKILMLSVITIFHTDIKIKFGGKRMLYLLSKTETRMIDLGDGFFA